MLQLLLSQELVDVNAKASHVSDSTPLMEAVLQRQWSVAETLIRHGADLTMSNKVCRFTELESKLSLRLAGRSDCAADGAGRSSWPINEALRLEEESSHDSLGPWCFA